MTTNSLNRMSALLLAMTICAAPNLCRAQGTSDISEPESTRSVPLNDRESPAVSSINDPGISITDSGDGEELRTPEEFLSTSRASIPASDQVAPSGSSNPAQFWAIHELILASIAIDGVASHEVLNQISASTLSDEHKELLFARFAGRGDGIAEEFTSESRGWLQDAGGKISKYAKDRYISTSPPSTSSFGTMNTTIVTIRNSSGWNVSMQFSGSASRRTLLDGRYYPDLDVSSDGVPWIQLQQPNGQWGTRWTLTHGRTYTIVNRGGSEPLVPAPR